MPTAVPITAAPLADVQARRADPAGLARTIAILALASFAIGFVGVLAMNGPALTARPAAEQTAALGQPADAAPTPAPAALPASDDWNLPKAI